MIEIILACLLFPTGSSSLCWADTANESKKLPRDLTSLSIEELMNVEITSVSRKAESIANAAAAVFVISQEDIRRSGANNIPDVLRMVPGLDVARIDANKNAVTSRGFNGRFARKMLVLIDGRTVYTPFFSGVWWDRQDMILEDIERIEVIRGPGATLWGANAVNGVINIITKKAADTLGGIITAGGGNVDQGIGGVRYGVRLGNSTNLRVYSKYRNQASGVDSTGRKATDSWHAMRGGFRMDSRLTGGDAVTLQGDIYTGRIGETYTTPLPAPLYSRTFDSISKNFGGNVLSRWEHTVSESSDLSLQMYYDHTDQTLAVMGEQRDTLDLDFQHRFDRGKRQEIVWGFGYRFIHDKIDNRPPTFLIFPNSRGNNLFSAFVQDDITLVVERLRLTLGSKFEHNDYTGFEVQPNVRAIWTPSDRNSIWGSVSRAVRTPSRGESDGFTIYDAIPAQPLPIIVKGYGSKDFKSEELTAYELGYRVKTKTTASFDISTFFNTYHNLYSLNSSDLIVDNPTHPQYLTLKYTVGNNMTAETYGVEVASDWVVYEWWRIHSSYTFLDMKIHLHNQSVGPASIAGLDPRHQFSLRSQMDLGRKVEFDLWMRYVDKLPSIGIKRYITPDVRMCWKPRENIEISIIGQNLTHHHRMEFISEWIKTPPTETERSVFGKIALRY